VAIDWFAFARLRFCSFVADQADFFCYFFFVSYSSWRLGVMVSMSGEGRASSFRLGSVTRGYYQQGLLHQFREAANIRKENG